MLVAVGCAKGTWPNLLGTGFALCVWSDFSDVKDILLELATVNESSAQALALARLFGGLRLALVIFIVGAEPQPDSEGLAHQLAAPAHIPSRGASPTSP